MYDEQVDWEHFFLDYALRRGVILFWLAKEAVHDCKRSYAQTTRFELGEHVALARHLDAPVVVGIEDGYTGAKYVRRTLGKKYPEVMLRDTLEDTCWAALMVVDRGR